MEILAKFKEGFWGFDWIILLVAVINILLFLETKRMNGEISENLKELEKQGNLLAANKAYSQFTKRYTIFLTIISIFPLLGMLGTVWSLLSLDITVIDDNLKSNFFAALTSTAWGIICAVGFKLANSLISTSVENTIQKLETLINKFEDMEISSENQKSRVEI